MNIAFFLVPKQDVVFLYDDATLKQGLDKIRRYGFSAVPVITRKNEYIGTVSEGDFLWYLFDGCEMKDSTKPIDGALVRDILSTDRNPSVKITSSIEELFMSILNQNFIPVVDDRNLFVGIVTRKDIMKHLCKTVVR